MIVAMILTGWLLVIKWKRKSIVGIIFWVYMLAHEGWIIYMILK